jgi:predicted permease
MAAWARRLAARVRGMFGGGRGDADRAREIAAHLALLEEEFRAKGLSGAEAHRQARLKLGNAVVIREEVRRASGLPFVENLWRDVVYALRQMRRAPGFALTAVLTLAIGIGAAAAMFTVVDHVLLQPFPYKDSGRLVTIIETAKKGDGWSDPSWPDIQQWNAERHLFAGMGFSRWVFRSDFLIGNNAAAQVRDCEVSSNLFQVLGVQPELGRGFAGGADGKVASADANSIVLSDAIWRAEFGADRGILGKVVRLNNTPYTVIGVMPPGFRYPAGYQKWSSASRAAQVWVPVQITAQDQERGTGSIGYSVIARLKQGVSLESARAAMAVIQKGIVREYSNPRDRWVRADVKVTPYANDIVNVDVRKALLALMAAAGVLWLIASLNVTNLLLARATARQREIAMRGALGASRWRVAQQTMVEGLVMSAAAAVLGGGLAFGSVRLLAHGLRANLPLPVPARPDTWILVALIGMTVVSALVSTAWPALLSARAPIEPALRQGGMQAGTGRKQHRMRGTLVAVEVALSLTLLVVCGLLLRTICTLRHVPLGYRTDHVLVAHLVIPSYRYKDQDLTQVLYEPLLKRVQDLHGVQAAGMMSEVPLGRTFAIQLSMRMNGHMILASLKPVTPEIQQVFGLKMLAGRFFNKGDTPTSEPVVVVNPAFVREYAPDKANPESIVGSEFFWNFRKAPTKTRIVGVLGNERQTSVSEASQPEIEVCMCQITKNTGVYWPFTTAMDLAVRTEQPEAVMIPELRDVLRQADPALAQAQITTMDQIVEDSYGSQRLAAHLLEIFGGSALLLCVAGLYGLLAYVVTQRTREMGLRIALGAQRGDLLWLVLRQAAVMLMVGVALGIGLALASAQVVQGFLYGVKAHDVWTLAGASVALLISGLIAAYIPARRAASVDPMQALRAE